ncbi:MAG: cupredoxin domain-containing protein [Acidimicrobiales bacterium]
MKRRPRNRFLFALLALCALVLVGCGSSGGGKSSPTTTGAGGSSKTTAASGGSGGSQTVEISNFKFVPPTVKAKVGDTITFKNSDSATHTAASLDGAPSKFDTGDLKKGDSKDVKVTKAGSYKYHCGIHEYMKGTIEVA